MKPSMQLGNAFVYEAVPLFLVALSRRKSATWEEDHMSCSAHGSRTRMTKNDPNLS